VYLKIYCPARTNSFASEQVFPFTEPASIMSTPENDMFREHPSRYLTKVTNLQNHRDQLPVHLLLARCFDIISPFIKRYPCLHQ
jgi:hypothetical protein